MRLKRIGLITTIDTNIGDDFIREGIQLILTEIYRNEQIEFVTVNKHKPFTVYPGWHPIHLRDITEMLPIGKNLALTTVDDIFPSMGFSRFHNCDLIIQCGAPVFWPNCSHSEWAKPLWYDVVGRLHEKIPVINLAAGSCYPWEHQPEVIEPEDDEQYLRSVLGYCRLTSVRDDLSKKICGLLGYQVPLIPCSALQVGRTRKVTICKSGYILINYMTGGGHYAWDQDIDNEKWEKTIKILINRLRKNHKIAFLCHDEKEFLLSKKLSLELPIFFPKSTHEYLDCVSQSIFGICNRMHASVAMAGLGIPSIAVCTDTRLLMVSQIGLPTHYVKDANADILEEETENGIRLVNSERDRLLSLQDQAWNNYISIIKGALHLQ